MNRLKKTMCFKIISIILVILFLCQSDFLFTASNLETLNSQFSKAINCYIGGDLKNAIKYLVRLEARFEDMKNRYKEIEHTYGQALLLLGACCEREDSSELTKTDKQQLKKIAREKYRLAKEKLGTGAKFSIPDVDLSDLKIYKKIAKEDPYKSNEEKTISPGDAGKILNGLIEKFTNKGTRNVISKSGSKKKKFPWLLVAGGVVAVGVIAFLLLKKKTNRTLTVTVGEGVDGNPANGIHTYKQGSNAGYSYTLKNGYSSLSVKLDGADVATSGTITMDKDHILTITAAKTYTLTATKGIGVDGTPTSGTISYNSGDTVNYSYSLQAGYQDLVVKIDGLDASASGTITMNANHTLSASAGKTYTLTVTKGTGVIGLPDTGTFSYKESTEVNYSYSLQTGYTDLVVILDGIQINPSGIITMDRDHTLSVTSGKTYTLTVSKGTGVDGTPASGTFTYLDGNSVSYNYSLQDGYKNLTITIDGVTAPASGSITMNGDHTVVASATAQDEYMLVVTKPKGVTGTPDAGTTSHKEGTSVSYNYSAQSGYRELTVKVDGNAVSASGTVTMNGNHSLVASVKEEKTLTVTRGTGINGTPLTGTFKYSKGTFVDYSYTLKTGYTDLVVTLDGSTVAASGKITMNDNHTLVASASTAYTLTVTRNVGVDGTPVTNVYSHSQGSIVEYSYAAQAGYQNLIVTLDGNPVAASGNISMNGNHTLVASATKTWTLTVTRGEGVDGNPASGVSTFANGASASYNYSLQGGYTNLVVTLDGNPVAASGSITMTADHTLAASATVADKGKR